MTANPEDSKNRKGLYMSKGWKVVDLGNTHHFKLATGGTPSTSQPEYWNGKIPWLKSGDVHQKLIRSVDHYISQKGFENSNATLFPVHTVLIALAGQGKTRGTAAITEMELTTNQSVAGIIPNRDTVDPYFLYYYIDSKYEDLRQISLGSGRAGLSLKVLRSVRTPLPPLPEQHRIATILSTVDAAIAATDEVIAKTEDLKRGLMQDLLTKGIDEEGRVRSEETHEFCEKQGMRVPVEWSVVKFSQICKQAFNGGTPSTKIPEYWEGTIPWITGADVVDQRIGEVRRYITPEAVENSTTHVIPKGMLLLVTRTGVGKVAIAPFDIAISQDLTGIIPTDNASAEYLFWVFNRANGHFLNMNQGTSINGITRTDLMNFALPLPPLPEQRRIAAVLSTVDRDLAAERDHRARLQTLKKGLMQDLLTGRKRVPLNGGEVHGA